MTGKPQSDDPADKKVVAYCRVSSHGQTEDLQRQQQDLAEACAKLNQPFEMISDCGSGINYRKRGLTRLLRMILKGEVSTLVLPHRDRLLRFGSQLLFNICEYFEVRVLILHEQEDEDFEKQLATDLIEIITVFTSRVYGRRAQENPRRRLAAA